MKVQSVELKYFKKFKNKHLDFTNPETGLARYLILLIGKNGSEKTSIIQAIAATLGAATGRLKSLYALDLMGYHYEILSNNWGRFEP